MGVSWQRCGAAVWVVVTKAPRRRQAAALVALIVATWASPAAARDLGEPAPAAVASSSVSAAVSSASSLSSLADSAFRAGPVTSSGRAQPSADVRYATLTCEANRVRALAPDFVASVSDQPAAPGRVRVWKFAVPAVPAGGVEAAGVRATRMSEISARFAAPTDAVGAPVATSSGPRVHASIVDGTVVVTQDGYRDLEKGSPGYTVEVVVAHGGATPPPPSWEFRFTASGTWLAAGDPFSSAVVCSSAPAQPATAQPAAGLSDVAPTFTG